MSPAGIPEPSERVAAESPVAGMVLTGGRSRRMGRDKCAIVLDGRTLLQRVVDALDGAVDELLVVGSPGRPPLEVRSTRPLRALADPEPHGGPLVGIATGLAATTAPVTLIVACDLPYLAPPLLRLLAARAGAGAQLVVPLRGGGATAALRRVASGSARHSARPPRGRRSGGRRRPRRSPGRVVAARGLRRGGPRRALVRQPQHTRAVGSGALCALILSRAGARLPHRH